LAGDGASRTVFAKRQLVLMGICFGVFEANSNSCVATTTEDFKFLDNAPSVFSLEFA
jgi:hypothetical protein